MIFGAGSPLEPLVHRTYRQLWLGALCLNVGLWMQTVSAGWMMVSLQGSPLQIGLVQTASTLPAFLLALPGGVIADLVNRRRLMMGSQAVLAGVALVTAALVASGLVAPWLLLCLTFAYGVGYAMQGPAWFTAQNDAVPSELRLAAVSLGSASFSSARAVGPALAGLLMASLSPTAVFGFIGMLALFSLILLRRVGPIQTFQAPRAPDAQVEGFGAAFKAALRYARHNRRLQGQLLRAGLFVLPGSALWALLPLVAGREGGAAGAYGLMLGCLGVGAVTGSLMLAAINRRHSVRRIETLAFLAFAAATVTASQTSALHWLAPALVIAGMAWAWSTNLVVTAIQMQAAPAMRARGLAIYLVVFQGSMAIGGWMWGALAGRAGLEATLLIACSGIAIAVAVRQFGLQH